MKDISPRFDKRVVWDLRFVPGEPRSDTLGQQNSAGNEFYSNGCDWRTGRTSWMNGKEIGKI